MDTHPFVSVIIPVRNERRFIAGALDSILAGDYPGGRLEILAVDGMSDDGTRGILERYAARDARILVLRNPDRTVPAALNRGIRRARGDVIVRMDAHAVYGRRYISRCVAHLAGYQVDNVGGVCVTLPGAPTRAARAIALALTHVFGVGNSRFRTGTARPACVDTVPFGCFRREVFGKVGYFNEHLVRNQDLEFNARLRKAGGKILLAPDVVSYYRARPDFPRLFRQNYLNGFWVVYGMRYARLPFSPRHLAPLAFVTVLLGSLAAGMFARVFWHVFLAVLAAYALLNVLAALSLALRRNVAFVPYIAVAFATLHFSYGAGSIAGAARLLGGRRHV